MGEEHGNIWNHGLINMATLAHDDCVVKSSEILDFLSFFHRISFHVILQSSTATARHKKIYIRSGDDIERTFCRKEKSEGEEKYQS